MAKDAAIFVPVKGNSERIDSKNTKLLDGKPLFLHTLEKLAFNNSNFDVYLDTEDPEILRISSYLHDEIHILHRDPDLATNKTDGNSLFINEVMHCNHPIIVQHLCTSPFISIDTVHAFIEILKKNVSCKDDAYDSCLLIRKEKLYTWSDNEPDYDKNSIPNSKDLEDTTIETMGLYSVLRDTALKTGRRIGNNPYLFNASPLEAFDVNWPDDFDMAQLIAAGKREKERKLLDNLALLMSSPLLSDLLDDLGFPNQVIKNLKFCSVQNASVLGPAKTLKLRKIESPSEYKDIYKALSHYETMVTGDILVVQNNVPEYAYFGELNANLAIRQGVRAVVIGGKTRDSRAVATTNLPVFSTGYTCQDVRKRAVFDEMNSRIFIEDVAVDPGDYVFADKEGVIIIPKKLFSKVSLIFSEKLHNEDKIISDIAMGATSSQLLTDRGNF